MVLAKLFLELQTGPQQRVTWSAKKGICLCQGTDLKQTVDLPGCLTPHTLPQNGKMRNLQYLWNMTVSGSLVEVIDTALPGSILCWLFTLFLLFTCLGSTSGITAVGSPAFSSQLSAVC